MLFSSIIFVFCFLPIVLLLYYIIPRKAKNLFLLLASVLFYTWGEGSFILILLFTTFVDFIGGGIIAYSRQQKATSAHRKKKLKRIRLFALIVSLSVNIGFLVFYKYANFGIENYLKIMHLLGFTSCSSTIGIYFLLPLGISFFTFQSMSYIIDVYRGKVQASKNYIDYACFVTLFPQLIAGPIVRYETISSQLQNRSHTLDKFSYGVKRFIIGLSKKLLIANVIATAADSIFSIAPKDLTISLAWIGIIAYTLQIYFDFSGYSDMAIGLGYMFGFKFLENFNYPYIATSIRDFWRRWHISLSTWFRDYVYIPLGGNRSSTHRTYINLLIVFFLCGLWHGARWTFVIWGIYHGFFLVIERIFLEKTLEKLWSPIKYIYSCLVIMIGWVIFRSTSISYAIEYIQVLFGKSASHPIISPLSLYINNLLVLTILVGILCTTPLFPYIAFLIDKNRSRNSIGTTKNIVILLGLILLLIGCCIVLARGSYDPFIYFRF